LLLLVNKKRNTKVIINGSPFTFHFSRIHKVYFYTNVVSGDKMATRPPLKIVVEGHEGYRTIMLMEHMRVISRIFEAIVYTDEMIADEAVSAIPEEAQWLSRHIGEYGKTFRKIVTPKKWLRRKNRHPLR